MSAQAASAAPLSAVFITGASAYQVEELTAIYAEELGAPVTPELLDELRRRIQARYRADGYVAPEVSVSTTPDAPGYPRLHIYETQLAGVEVRGDAGPHAGQVATLVKSLAHGPLDRLRTQRVLKSIDALPGLHVKAALQADPQDATRHTLVLNLRHDPVDGVISAHNRGSEDFGEEMLGARLTLNGFLGQGEALTFTGLSATEFDQYHYTGLAIARHFSFGETTLSGSRSWAEPESDAQYDGERIKLDWRMPELALGAWTMEPLAAFTVRQSQWRDDLGRSELTRTRSFETGVKAEHDAGDVRTRLRSSYVFGIDRLGAEAEARYGATPELAFGVALLSVEHRRPIAPRWRVRVEGEGQWSDDDLPAGERFTFGGARFGRGFEPGAIVADRGVAGSVQLETERQWPGAWLDYGRLFGQADYARGWDVSGGAENASSITAGAGARIQGVISTLELSYALDRPDDVRRQDAQVFLSIYAPF